MHGPTSRLNGYMYSNDTSLNVVLFILMAKYFVSKITLQLLGVNIISCSYLSYRYAIKTKDLAPVYLIWWHIFATR